MAPVAALARPTHILRLVMMAAIRERRLLSLTYERAVEPQLFAPLTLYVSATNRLVVEGYEVRGKECRWREVKLEIIRAVQQTRRTFDLRRQHQGSMQNVSCRPDRSRPGRLRVKLIEAASTRDDDAP